MATDELFQKFLQNLNRVARPFATLGTITQKHMPSIPPSESILEIWRPFETVTNNQSEAYSHAAAYFEPLNRPQVKHQLDWELHQLHAKADTRIKVHAADPDLTVYRPHYAFLKTMAANLILLLDRSKDEGLSAVHIYRSSSGDEIHMDAILVQAYRLLRAYDMILTAYADRDDFTLDTQWLDHYLSMLFGKMVHLTKPSGITEESEWLRPRTNWGDARGMRYHELYPRNRRVCSYGKEAQDASMLLRAKGLVVIYDQGGLKEFRVYGGPEGEMGA